MEEIIATIGPWVVYAIIAFTVFGIFVALPISIWVWWRDLHKDPITIGKPGKSQTRLTQRRL